MPTNTSSPALTADPLRLCSPSYRGLATRTEMWVMLVILCGVQFLANAVPDGYGEPVTGLFHLIFALPLIVRRARQMGATWYGIFVIVSPLIVLPLTNWLIISFATKADIVLYAQGILCYIILMFAPLYVYGGALAGRKNELMRAAIAGDFARARELLAEHPQMLLQKSEKGHTARQYAERQGHHELAAWLREQEEVHTLPLI